ncbi:hypothetical protein D3C79_723650 [compost metagenome]
MAQHPLELGDGQRALVAAGISLTERPDQLGVIGIGGQRPLQLGDGRRALVLMLQRLLACAIGGRGPLRLLLGEQGHSLLRLCPRAEGAYVQLQLGHALGPDRHILDIRQPDLGGFPPVIFVQGHLLQQRPGLQPASIGQIVARQPGPHPGLAGVLAVQRLQRSHALGSLPRDAHLQQGILDRHLQIRRQIVHKQRAVESLPLFQPTGVDQQPGLLQLLALGRVVDRQVRHPQAIEPRVRRHLAESVEQGPGLLDLALTQRLPRLGRQQFGMIGFHQGEGIEGVADQILPPGGFADAHPLQQGGDGIHRRLCQVAPHQRGEQATQG